MPTTIGRKPAAPPASDAGFGTAAAAAMRTTRLGTVAGHHWIYRAGARVGKQSGAPNGTARVGLYQGASTPGARDGYTAGLSITAVMADNTGGHNHEADLAAPYRAASGTVLWGSLHADVNWAHGQDNSGATMYHRAGVAGDPPDPNGYTSSSPEGQMSIWAIGQANSAPNTPSAGLAPTGTINTTAPTFTANFVDADETLPGFAVGAADKLYAYAFELWAQGSPGTLLWASSAVYAATGAEQAARAVSRGYGGAALSPGVAYEWRVRVADLFGAWSGWSATQAFTVNGGGFVDTAAGTPTGKQETLTPGPFTGVWTHASGLATNAVEARLVQNRVVVQSSPTIAATVATGNTVSVSWASAAFANLTAGGSYAYQLRGRDTGNLWSDWSAARAFTVDALPTQPISPVPSNGQPISALPLLSFAMSDPDDTTASGLVGGVHIESAVSVSNPDFGANDTGWTDNGNTAGVTATKGRATDQSVGAVGSYKIAVTANTAGVGAVARAINDTFVPVTTGLPLGRVRAGAWGRCSTANLSPCLPVSFYDASFALLSTVFVTFPDTPANAWTLLFGYATVPVGAAYAKLELAARADVAGATGDVWLDHPRLDGLRIPTYNATTGRWEYQTTALDLPFFEAHTWRAWGHDGTFQGPFSPSWTFVYAQGPVVTVTAPTAAQVLTTNTPTVTWTVTGQVKRRVRVYDDATDALLHDSGEATTAGLSYVVPSGVLHNDGAYYLTVEVTDSTPLTGTSAQRNFTVDFPTPASIGNFAASPEQAEGDPTGRPSAVLLTWEASATGGFQRYELWRRPTGSVAGGPDDARIAVLTSQSTVAYLDDGPPSGESQTYAIRQIVLQGTDSTESDRSEAEATATLAGIVLVDPETGTRVVLRYLEAVEVVPRDDRATLVTWDDKPTVLLGEADWKEASFTAQVGVDATDLNVAEAMERLRALRGLRADGTPVVLLYRDDRGERFFGSLSELPQAYRRRGWYEVRGRVVEVGHEEAV